MNEQAQRQALDRLIAGSNDDYAGISRLIGKNPAYIQQYIKRGSPKRLAEDDRRLIARYFGVDEAVLGGVSADDRKRGRVTIGRLAVGASAGGGALPGEERNAGAIGFDEAWLRRLGVAAAGLSLITVEGDSMEPTLSRGDDIMVDTAAAGRPLRDGIHVVRIDGALMVKRLARAPGGRLSVISDSEAYGNYELDAAEVDVVGRVVWAGKRM